MSGSGHQSHLFFGGEGPWYPLSRFYISLRFSILIPVCFKSYIPLRFYICYEAISSRIFSTQTSAGRCCIQGQYRAARIYDQSITWGNGPPMVETSTPFDISTILVYCTCKYFDKSTRITGMCCSHIIGQIRRTIFLQGQL